MAIRPDGLSALAVAQTQHVPKMNLDEISDAA